MGLFRRRRKLDGDSLAKRFITDRTWNDVALDAGIEAVGEGHLAAGTTLLAETRGDPESRVQRVGSLGSAAVGRSGDIADLAEDDPNNPDLWLWLGCTVIDEAWAIRGGGWASSVGEDRFKLFFSTLRNAPGPLLRAAELRDDDAAPWEAMLWFAIGMQLDREDKDQLWRQVVERCPSLYPAHWARLQMLAQKWGGSHEEMFAFARESVATAPVGHPVVAMLPLAHFEFLLKEEDRLLEEGKKMALLKLYISHFSGERMEEIKAAGDKWTRSARPHPRDLEAHHLFGAAYSEALDEEDLARWHLGRVGSRVHSIPWAYLGTGDVLEEYADVLRKLKLPLPDPIEE